MNFRLKIGHYNIGLRTSIRKDKQQKTIGYTNRCEDGKYIIFLDYDNLEYQWVINELRRLQSDYMLGDFYIFQSGENNYHAVCFDKVVMQELLVILKNSSVDQNYIDVPAKWGKKIWTLRLTDKKDIPIEYMRRVDSEHTGFRWQSKAHATIIENLFGMKIRLRRADETNKICLALYTI